MEFFKPIEDHCSIQCVSASNAAATAIASDGMSYYYIDATAAAAARDTDFNGRNDHSAAPTKDHCSTPGASASIAAAKALDSTYDYVDATDNTFVDGCNDAFAPPSPAWRPHLSLPVYSR
jgi:hypothetical protein